MKMLLNHFSILVIIFNKLSGHQVFLFWFLAFELVVSLCSISFVVALFWYAHVSFRYSKCLILCSLFFLFSNPESILKKKIFLRKERLTVTISFDVLGVRNFSIQMATILLNAYLKSLKFSSRSNKCNSSVIASFNFIKFREREHVFKRITMVKTIEQISWAWRQWYVTEI